MKIHQKAILAILLLGLSSCATAPKAYKAQPTQDPLALEWSFEEAVYPWRPEERTGVYYLRFIAEEGYKYEILQSRDLKTWETIRVMVPSEERRLPTYVRPVYCGINVIRLNQTNPKYTEIYVYDPIRVLNGAHRFTVIIKPSLHGGNMFYRITREVNDIPWDLTRWRRDILEDAGLL